MANSNGWGDGAANNSIGWGQGANNAIAWGDSHAKSWSGATDIVGIDSDAQAFITAAAITDPVQINAINTLVEGMKTDGIWTKMKAVYPFVGGTASAHKWNLKDPRDLDAAFRLVFNGGWTHSANGATPNGTNGYADTKLSPSAVLTSANNHASFYSRTQYLTPVPKDQCLWGSLNNPNYFFADIYNNVPKMDSTNGGFSFMSATLSNTQGLIATSITSTSLNGQKTYQNGIVKVSNTNAIPTLPSANLYLSSLNISNSSVANYAPFQAAFASIGDGLTDTEASNLYTRVQAFQTALSRQV